MISDVLFRVEHVTRRFPLPRTRRFAPRRSLTAVDDVSLVLRREETLGVVGESASGKTTLMKLLLGLDRPDQGSITYLGQSLRRDVQVVFQDPASALDPRMRVDQIIMEPLHVLRIREDHRTRLAELMDAVEIGRASCRERVEDAVGRV